MFDAPNATKPPCPSCPLRKQSLARANQVFFLSLSFRFAFVRPQKFLVGRSLSLGSIRLAVRRWVVGSPYRWIFWHVPSVLVSWLRVRLPPRQLQLKPPTQDPGWRNIWPGIGLRLHLAKLKCRLNYTLFCFVPRLAEGGSSGAALP